MSYQQSEDEFGTALIAFMLRYKKGFGTYPSDGQLIPMINDLAAKLQGEARARVDSEREYIVSKLDALRDNLAYPDDMAFAISQILRGYHKD
jgi:hypothetical protein